MDSESPSTMQGVTAAEQEAVTGGTSAQICCPICHTRMLRVDVLEPKKPYRCYHKCPKCGFRV